MVMIMLDIKLSFPILVNGLHGQRQFKKAITNPPGNPLLSVNGFTKIWDTIRLITSSANNKVNASTGEIDIIKALDQMRGVISNR